MSEFHVVCVELGKIGKHPNAERLAVTQVHNYPVCVGIDAFKPGDLAIHIPPDALVDTTRPEFDFLKPMAGGVHHRVKFVKLRGVPSYGFLVPAPAGAVPGQDFREYLAVEKYESGEEIRLNADGKGTEGPQDVPKYDIEGLRKYESLIPEGTPVVIHEKVHGANGRWLYRDGKLHCGSRNRWVEDSIWNRMAEKYELEKVLSENPGLVLYGEVYGKGCQDLAYCVEDQRVVFFDLYDTTDGQWYSPAVLEDFCGRYNLPMAPQLYKGPFNLAQAYELAEGVSLLAIANYDEQHPGCAGKFHTREGVVVKPQTPMRSEDFGRVFLKLAGQGYLSR